MFYTDRKQIASQQVDAATRENFLSQQRAFKLTLTIIALVIISYSPMIIFRIIIERLKDLGNVMGHACGYKQLSGVELFC